MNSKEKLQQVFAKAFRFDVSTLDFGPSYASTNRKRQSIERWVMVDLPKAVDEALDSLLQAEMEDAQIALEILRRVVEEALGTEAFDGDGNLKGVYAQTNVGRAYMWAKRKASAQSLEPLKETIYGVLLDFFSRFLQDKKLVAELLANEQTLTEELPKAIQKELKWGGFAKYERLVRELGTVLQEIRRMEENLGTRAFDTEGNLTTFWPYTPIGQRYLELQAKVQLALEEAVETTVHNVFRAFLKKEAQA